MAAGNALKKNDGLPDIAKPPTPAKGKKSQSNKSLCTPFCDPKIPCPKHHDLIVALMNCSDHLGAKSNLVAFQQCVIRCIDAGWDKDDVVADASEDLRFPLVHLACAFAKCSALDWLISYGFDPHVKSETTGQFALQRGIVGICRAKHRGTHKELIPKMKRFIIALRKQLMFHDEINGDTPLHTATVMLSSVDLKPQFFEVGYFFGVKPKSYVPGRVKPKGDFSRCFSKGLAGSSTGSKYSQNTF